MTAIWGDLMSQFAQDSPGKCLQRLIISPGIIINGNPFTLTSDHKVIPL